METTLCNPTTHALPDAWQRIMYQIDAYLGFSLPSKPVLMDEIVGIRLESEFTNKQFRVRVAIDDRFAEAVISGRQAKTLTASSTADAEYLYTLLKIALPEKGD